jgi:hypothetical protein
LTLTRERGILGGWHEDAQAQLDRLNAATQNAELGSARWNAANVEAGYIMQSIKENDQKAQEAAARMQQAKKAAARMQQAAQMTRTWEFTLSGVNTSINPHN